jgi:signal transduction histidine kinase
MTTTPAAKPASLWLRVLRWPVEPSRGLDEVNRRNARLLLGMEIVVILGLLMSNIFAPPQLGTRVALALVVIAYAVTRTRHYLIGGGVTMGILSAAVLIFFEADRSVTFEYASVVLIWTALPVVLASMFFSVRGTLIVALANLAIIVLAGFITPGLTPLMALDASGFSITIFPLLIVGVNHRNQLEKIRQAELKAANDALLRSEAELEQRVFDRTAEIRIAKEEAESARSHAERADQVKSQFLASMSHELRTPLNAILNFTEMMALGMVGDVTAQQKDILEKSLNSGRHLLDLINDVLDVSKMQSGMLALFLEENVNLREELAAVSSAAQSLLANKPVRLVEEIEGELPLLNGDRRRIRQILLNLVSNAVKFTEKGTVTISARQKNGEVIFGVIDTGPGIPLDQQERIFLPFVQTEKGIQHVGGTGLGLAISRHLAEAHGGKLWVESKLGEGSAFYVSLPVRGVPVQGMAAPSSEVQR